MKSPQRFARFPHRLPPRAVTLAREPHRRTALGAPAGPLDRKPHWARRLADLATKAGGECGLRLWWVPLLLVLAPAVGYMPAHRDLIDFFAPMRRATAEMIGAGTAPWLNLANGCGEAWFANPETAILYPPAWFHLVLPVPWAMTLEIGLHLALLSLGVGLLARDLGASRLGRLLTEAAAWSAGPVLVTVGVLNNLETLAWVPWMVLAARLGDRRSVPLLAAATAMAWLGGEPQVWAVGVALVIGVARARGPVMVGLALGVAIVAVQLVPFLVWVAEGDRGPSAAAWALRGALAPADWGGVLTPGVVRDGGRMVYAESLFLGAPVLVCALLGGWRRKWVLAVVVFLGILATLPEIGGGGLFLAITGGLVRYPSRFALIGLVVLLPFVGKGADDWLAGRGRWLAVAVSGVTLTACAMGAHPWRWWIAGIPAALMLVAAFMSSRRILRGVVLAAGAAGMIVAGLPLLEFRPVRDLRTSTPTWPEATDGARVYTPAPAADVMRWLATGLGPRRLWPVGYLNLEDGLTLARTDAPVANGRLAKHLAIADEGPSRRWWLDVLGARWVILPTAEASPEAMEEVRERGGMQLFRNLRALPVLSVADDPPHPHEPWHQGGEVTGMELEASRLSATTVAKQDGWLWVSLAPVQGWQWRVDGREVELEQGPGIVQYLEISAGRHRLEGRYRPPALISAAIVSGLAVLAVLAALVSSLLRWRSDRPFFGVRRAPKTSKALMVGVILFVSACGGGPPEDELDRELNHLLERTRNLATRAAQFDHDGVLRDIGVDAANGTLYRFDDHLEEANHEAIGRASANYRPVLAALELKGGRAQQGGIVDYLVDLPVRDIGALELQLVVPPGERLKIELQGEQTGEAVTIDLHAVGDGAVYTYRLELAEALASWTGERLVGLRIQASDPRDTEPFEIRSAFFRSLTAAYAYAPYGVTYRRQSGEARQSIFQWSSSVLRFPVRIERTIEAEFDVGAAFLLTDTPVRVEVALNQGGGSRNLLSTRLEAGDGWTDWRIPLGLLGAGDHVIELRVTADQPNIVFWSNPAVVTRPEHRFNVIMVLEDALRADHLSCYGYRRDTTPVKDAFARRGVRFARCYAQATKTRFSCPSFMTSLYPTATGIEGIWHPYPSLHENYITLAEILRRRGFVTASIHQNANAGSPAGLHQGFSYLLENVPGRAEDFYTSASLRWIERHRDRNFLLYLHLIDPHEPYNPPEGFNKWFEELEAGSAGEARETPLDRQNPRWMQEARRALYDGEISANDHWFAALLERLKELDLDNDTLVIFMADHGEHLGEHGQWSHSPPSYVQVLHTPLIMVYPRRISGRLVVNEIVQNLDIMPTILEFAGVDGEALLIQGNSLLPLMVEGSTNGWSRNLSYAEDALLKKKREDPRPYGSIFFDRWHVLDSLFAPMKLFDVDLDPIEANPLRSTRRLRDRFPTFLRDMQLAELEIWRGVTQGEDTTVTLDPETISGLKALGYLE